MTYEVGITILLGILLAFIAAAGIGFAMVIQRYGLIHDRFRVWFAGLAIYGAANGLQAASLTFGPLFLLGGVFTLLLVFNLVFARVILGEETTVLKLCGALVMIGGVAMAVNAAPPEAKTEFSGRDIDARIVSAEGMTWVILLFVSLGVTIFAMLQFERKYPAAQSVAPSNDSHPRLPRAVQVDPRAPPPPRPSKNLNNLMAVVYPMSVSSEQPQPRALTPQSAAPLAL